MSRSITILEVSPRDGLQNEKNPVSTEDKLHLIGRAIDAGLRRIEVTSFVHPKRVPQMADAEAVCAGLPDRKDVSYIGLVLNRQGLDRAIATGRLQEAGAVVVASDTFGMKNQGQTIAEGIEAARDIIRAAKAAGLKAQVTVSAAFGCPFEGDVPVSRVIDIAKRVAEAGPFEIAFADTIGCGVPSQVQDIIGAAREALPQMRFRGHFHNTRNTGLANAYAAIEAGVSVLDASIGGLGGCPYAPNATGNIPTDDLLFMLDRMGIETGVDLDKIIATSLWLESKLGKATPAMLPRAGKFTGKAKAA
jgi:hydroxymethylglutaryl-CoA lyase